MKKSLIVIFILIILLLLLSFGYYKHQKGNVLEKNLPVEENKKEPDLKPNEEVYKDNNPIKLSLYKYYGHNKNRVKITEYTAPWLYHTDISSFEVFYTTESEINGDYLQNTFKEYFNKYENIDNYKIGYHINFLTTEKEINKTILSPKDTEEFFDYLEIYLYDDYHREIGHWYSHTTESEMNENTFLTSIKLTAGKKVYEITSDIAVTVFTYDNDDFDDELNYRGNSKYKIIVKKES